VKGLLCQDQVVLGEEQKKTTQNSTRVKPEKVRMVFSLGVSLTEVEGLM
jgi:hypothetical protein